MKAYVLFQYIWLGLGIFTTIIAVNKIVSGQPLVKDDYVIIFIAIVSFVMFVFKKSKRKYFEEQIKK